MLDVVDGVGVTVSVGVLETRDIFAAAVAVVRKHQVKENLHLRVAAVGAQ